MATLWGGRGGTPFLKAMALSFSTAFSGTLISCGQTAQQFLQVVQLYSPESKAMATRSAVSLWSRESSASLRMPIGPRYSSWISFTTGQAERQAKHSMHE